VTAKGQETISELATGTLENGLDGRAHVVVQTCRRNALKEGIGGVMTILNGLQRFRLICFNEDGVTKRKSHAEDMSLQLPAIDDNPGFSKVHLAGSLTMLKREEHLPQPYPLLPNVVLHDCVGTSKTILLLQTDQNTLGRMTLFAGCLLVILQNLINDTKKGVQLGLGAGTTQPITRRSSV